MLRQWRETQSFELDFYPEAVVTTITGGHMAPGTLRTHFKRFASEAGLAVSFHALRQSFVTLSLVSGTDARTIAGPSGHADAGMVWQTYGHFVRSADQAAAERLEEFMRPS